MAALGLQSKKLSDITYIAYAVVHLLLRLEYLNWASNALK